MHVIYQDQRPGVVRGGFPVAHRPPHLQVDRRDGRLMERCCASRCSTTTSASRWRWRTGRGSERDAEVVAFDRHLAVPDEAAAALADFDVDLPDARAHGCAARTDRAAAATEADRHERLAEPVDRLRRRGRARHPGLPYLDAAVACDRRARLRPDPRCAPQHRAGGAEHARAAAGRRRSASRCTARRSGSSASARSAPWWRRLRPRVRHAGDRLEPEP